MNDSPFFINNSVEKVIYRGKEVLNNPVNLSLCKSINKSQFAWYPDNTGIPSIRFVGCDVEWVYENDILRDSDFKKISNNKFVPQAIKVTEPPSAAVAEGDVYGNDCPNGQCS